MTGPMTLVFTAVWNDHGDYARLIVGPYVAEAWCDGEWTVRVNGRLAIEAPGFAGGSLVTAKAAAAAWIDHDHRNRRVQAVTL